MRSTEEVKSIKALSSDVLVKIKFGNFLNPLDQEVPTMKKYKSQRNSTKGIDNFMENVALDSINSSLSSEGCFEQYLEERGIILKDSENGVMMEYISKSGSLSESTARYFFKQLIKAIIIKNKTEETHREIKPEEIILDSEFNLKLAYRNFSSKKECGYKINNALSYKAPEVLAGVEYEPKQVDLFSAAVFLFMMVTQRLPFIKAEPDDKYYSFIIIKDFNGFWAYHTLQCPEIAHLSEEFKDLF